jgi:AcrR family transcriptional regulator
MLSGIEGSACTGYLCAPHGRRLGSVTKMTPASDRAGVVNTELPASSSRKATQRERLIAGMIEVANRNGYANASISAVATASGVSKPTFYEYFRGREDGFAAAVTHIHARLLAEVDAAIAEQPPERAVSAGIGAIILFVAAEPELMRFLADEALAGASAILDVRDRGIAELCDTIDIATRSAAPDAKAPDLPLEVVVGGLYRVIASRLRRGERTTAALREGILEWLEYYEVAISDHRWRSPEPHPGAGFDFGPPQPLLVPEPLPPGRPRVSKAEVESNQRLRVMLALASLMDEQGYTATTIAQVIKRARVDLQTFYSLFSEKLDALIALQEFGAQALLAVTTSAFFGDANWADRAWEHGRVFLQTLDTIPAMARIEIVEAYAGGRRAAQQVEATYVPYTIFLREGLRYATTPNPPSPLAMEAINATYFELAYRHARKGEPSRFYGLLPVAASLWLPPFLGTAESNRIIDEKLDALDRSA